MNTAPQKNVRLRGDGLDLSADEYGPVEGTPVLFFHGGGQSRRSWTGVARELGDAGYRAFSIDMRGHGDSDWAADGAYLLEAYARDAEQLIDGFDQPVVLVGASRGGQAALLGAARRPDRVRLVMLADVAPLMRNEGIDEMRAFFRSSSKGFASTEEAAQALADQLRSHAGGQQRDASRLRKTMREGSDGRLYWKWDPETVNPKFLNPPSENVALELAASQVKAPVLLVRAELSNIVTDEGVAHFRALTPQLEIEIAKGVGHMVTGDRNDVFARSLIGRLSRLA